MKKHSGNGQKGQAAVEMAILLPILVLTLLAVIEVGRVLDAWLVATNAAREGARYAAHGESAGEVRNRVGAYLTQGLGGRTDVTPPAPGQIAVSGALGTPGDPVQVTVPMRVRIYTPFVSGLGLADPVTVQGVATMRLQ